MKFEYVVAANDFSQTLQGAKTALTQLGYRLESDAGRTLVYHRGNFLGALFATSPKSWQSTVVLEQVPQGLLVKLMVDMFGKVELPITVQYWQKELAHICRAAAGEPSPVETVKFERPSFWKLFLSLIGVFGGALILGVIAAMVLNTPLAIYVAMLIGCFLGGKILNRAVRPK